MPPTIVRGHDEDSASTGSDRNGLASPVSRRRRRRRDREVPERDREMAGTGISDGGRPRRIPGGLSATRSRRSVPPSRAERRRHAPTDPRIGEAAQAHDRLAQTRVRAEPGHPQYVDPDRPFGRDPGTVRQDVPDRERAREGCHSGYRGPRLRDRPGSRRLADLLRHELPGSS